MKDTSVPGRTIVIGDVHGCAKALEALLRVVDPQVDDTVIMLGDYVDRGPASRGVIERIIQLGDECNLVPLMGNHEIMLLAALDRPDDVDIWMRCGGAATIASYGDSLKNFPSEHTQFLYRCRRFHETDRQLFFHANYLFDVPADRQPDAIAFWHHLTIHLPAPHNSGKTVFVGHTPQSSGEVLDLGHVLCVDTYCFGGGWLTAMEVDTREIWQADRLGRVRK
ncbi:MAG: serine/threonine protein phosphatase [Planctomycetales bacterium]|nr:serine/threonine protein phosphatase [Planctomycetales bacterium]MCA9227495.1 serine/threonine protein phosphatase [Planctomycetales bacterium]